MTDFFQDPPELKNQYTDDLTLQNYLERVLPKDILKKIIPGLTNLGAMAADEILTLGNQAESQPPKHIPFDPWGRRIDHIEVSHAWKALEKIAATEKLVAHGYERKSGAFSRIHQYASIYLFSASSAIYTCPLAMTDGASRALELFGDEALKNKIFKRLTSSDPNEFWTSGQWMTERTGGSDVSTTTTIAKKENGSYRLYGDKWFTSATTSQVAMTLARIEGAPEGGRGLSLFCVELRNQKGELNNIVINRLKDKLGTKALPTAELSLRGTPAVLMGGEGDGVKKISALFNITRIWNCCCAISFMRRGLALAKDYARKRTAFGKKLIQQPLHLQTLADLEANFQLCFHLTFRLSELLGKEELKQSSKEEEILLRVLTPIAKLYTAKQAIKITSEILECFGGAGYVEDTGLPRLLRDSQVLSIWEGTTNVLSLDMLRAHKKEGALNILLKEIQSQLKNIKHKDLQSARSTLDTKTTAFIKKLDDLDKGDPLLLEASSRAIAFKAAQLYGTLLLGIQADWELSENKSSHSIHAFHRCISEYFEPAPINFQESESLIQ